MTCPKCGAELPEMVTFCSNCDWKTDNTNAQTQSTSMFDATPVTSNNTQTTFNGCSTNNNAEGKLFGFWNGLNKFSKPAVIAMIVVIILLIIAIFSKSVYAVILSALQLAGLIVASLMSIDVIKVRQPRTKYVILGVTILCSLLTISSYSWGKNGKPDTSSSTLSQSLVSDTPNSSAAPIDTSIAVPLSLADCIGKDFSDITSDFISVGFENVKTEAVEDLQSADADKANTVDTVSIADKTDFEQGQKFDKNDTVVIRYHAYKKCNVKIAVDFQSNLLFSTYDVKLLVNGSEKGTMKHGSGEEYELSLEPDEYTLTFENVSNSDVNGEVTLTVNSDIEASYKISCHSDKVNVETIYVDRLVPIAENEVKLDVASSEYKYGNYDDVKVELEKLGFTNIKSEVLYDIVFGITPKGEVESVSIAGNSDFKRGDVFAKEAEVIITYHMPEADNPNNITVPTSSSDYMGKDYVDVEKALRDLGFTDIETEPSITNDLDENGKVFSITIGETEFESGDVLPPNRTVTIMYFVYEKPKPVYYSTNDYETAKKGNTGVFAYKSGTTYYIYYIIDFDEGYVYYFTDGNGEESCDRLKIESGNLNSYITITYHLDGETWSERLHFKYENSPQTLIWNDHNGSPFEFSPTDLDNALTIRNKKQITDY